MTMAETVVTSNAHLEELAPSTADFYSSKYGWDGIDDEWIDSSITGALEHLPQITFEREHVGSLYRYTLFLHPTSQDKVIELGVLTYRQQHHKSVSLGYKSTSDILNNEELNALLVDAVTHAKIKVDIDHSVGVWSDYDSEEAPWWRIDEDKTTRRMLYMFLRGESFAAIANFAVTKEQVVKNKLGRLRDKYGEHTIPKMKDRGKFAKYFVNSKRP
jgi:hypothetical protein